jgi:hypothetical protein
MNRFLDTFVGGWQMGWLYNYATGSPFTITGQNSVNSFTTGFTPNVVGALPSAQVSVNGSYVTLFPGVTQIPDPSRALVTTTNALNTRATLFAVGNSSGSPIFVNTLPGQMGNIALGAFTSPPVNSLDLNVQKDFKLTERFNFQLRATASNALNHTQFLTPAAAQLAIGSSTFGHVTSTAASRVLVLQGRINF